MEYPVEWPRVVEALARELTQAKIELAMANAVIESLSREEQTNATTDSTPGG